MGTSEITTVGGLLASLFSHSELHQFIRKLPHGEQLYAELPGPGTPLTSLALAAQALLERHGLIDTSLFARLMEARRARCADIERVEGLVLAPALDLKLLSDQQDSAVQVLNEHGGRHDEDTRRLAEHLQEAIRRKERLQAAGASTDNVIEEILNLKRELRQGGQLREGDMLSDRYLLVKQIGRGGFATVWRAIDQAQPDQAQPDQAQNRFVAVKVLHGELAGDVVRRQRFFRGARLMSELDHPAVVRIREREVEDGGFYFFVMDYLAGGDLRNAVLAGRVRRDDAMPIILRVGQALTAAHHCGYVHRDVKPANILLSDTGEPFLTDFDLVAAMDTTGGTQTGPLGTFLYAAPEMLERPQDADARADVYGLGMTATFMICGTDLPADVMRDAPGFVASLDCERGLKKVLQRAVAWNADDRYANVADLCSALDAEPVSDGAILPPDAEPTVRPITVEPLSLEPVRELLQQALESDLATLGPSHPNVARDRHHLALVYKALGELEPARELYQQALESNLATRGPSHPDVARDRHNLALVLKALGEVEPARELLQQALASDLATLGPAHPDVVRDQSNLAGVLKGLGELEPARVLYQQALASALAIFGPVHPEIATLRNNLAGVLKDLGELELAQELYQQALHVLLEQLGPDHRHVAIVQQGLDSVRALLAAT